MINQRFFIFITIRKFYRTNVQIMLIYYSVQQTASGNFCEFLKFSFWGQNALDIKEV